MQGTSKQAGPLPLPVACSNGLGTHATSFLHKPSQNSLPVFFAGILWDVNQDYRNALSCKHMYAGSNK
jgi:hypothetical protein